VVDEATIVRQLSEALSDSPDVICLSAGTYTRKNVPPKTFTAFWDSRFSHHKGVALIAAAGNDSGRAPFWPAALPWAVSVGALSRDGQRRMDWSNYGGWVDLYAPGEDLVNAFPDGTYVDIHGTKVEFPDRMARWSGTSFATPLVAGLVARRIAETGENGWRAARALRLVARENFRRGVGPRLLL
jgi:subtilisin family serine protease